MPQRHIIESVRERRNIDIAKCSNHFANAIVNRIFRKRYIFNICKFRSSYNIAARTRFLPIVFAT